MFREFIEGDWKNLEVELIRGILPRRFLLTCRNAYSYDSRFTIATFFVSENKLEALLVYGNSNADEITVLKNENDLIEYLSAIADSESFVEQLKMTNDYPTQIQYDVLLRAGDSASTAADNIKFSLSAEDVRKQLKETIRIRFTINKPSNYNPEISVYSYELNGGTNQCFVHQLSTDQTKLEVTTHTGFSSTVISDLRKG
jgi:hypothetical protein